MWSHDVSISPGHRRGVATIARSPYPLEISRRWRGAVGPFEANHSLGRESRIAEYVGLRKASESDSKGYRFPHL
jgi:hypothetical protein